MMRSALNKNGGVENVIVADEAFIATLAGYDHIEALDTEAEQQVAGPGWWYDGKTGGFTPPPEQPPEPLVPSRLISRFTFRSRFSFEEKTAIYTAAATMVQIQVFLDDIASAEEIDLDLPDTVAGVHALEAAGLIAAGRAAEILA